MPKILTDPRKNILLEVEKLLSQGGCSAITVRSVAARCGVGVGTVYNYFPSKEALLAEYLLADWRQCIAAIDAASQTEKSAEPVARCIYDQLFQYAHGHMAVFGDEAARSAFTGSFSQYHSLLRSQLAAPLQPFCQSEFAAEFLAEALLTWTMAGKAFHEIWGMLCPLIKEK